MEKLAPGIRKSNFWASDHNGINQVGFVYTCKRVRRVFMARQTLHGPMNRTSFKGAAGNERISKYSRAAEISYNSSRFCGGIVI